MKFTEIKSLTGVRGLAALYVIIYHWYVLFIKPGIFNLTKNAFADRYITNFLSHGYLSVDLFFVLSGFVLSLTTHKLFKSEVSKRAYTTYMYKRFARIYPLYLVITLLFYFAFDNGGIAKLLVNLTLLQGIVPTYNSSIIPPGWSLTNEWVLYLFFPFIIHVCMKLEKRIWMLFFISITFLLLVSYIRSNFMNWSNYKELSDVRGFHPIIAFTRGPASFFRTISDYLLGIFSFVLYQKRKGIPLLMFTMITASILLFFNNSDILIIGIMPFLIIYLTKANKLTDFFGSRILHFLGLISYSLYVNHFLFILSFAKIAKLIGYDSHAFSFLYVTVLCIPFSCLTYYFIEKPALRYLHAGPTFAAKQPVVSTADQLPQ